MRVVVVGLGAMGLPTCRVLAERGHQVIGIDRHGISAPAGSSAGETRIFRLAHGRIEDIRLARRALELWRELEVLSGDQIIDQVGLILRGETTAVWAEAMRAEGVPVEELDAAGVARVFPELAFRPGEPAIFAPDDGVVFARRGLAAIAAAARVAGAELAMPERMLAIHESTFGVRVTTDRRTLHADAAVIAAGPWAQELLSPLGVELPLAPAIGQVSYWRGGGAWERRPSLVDFQLDGRMGVYGLPTPGKGYKIGLDYGDEDAWQPDATEWVRREFEEQCNREWVAAHAPGLVVDGPYLTEACPWTMTPDAEYTYGRRGSIVIAAGCCGHAMKFTPVLGEILADLTEGRELWPDAKAFAIERIPAGMEFERYETPMGLRISL